jgi:hypothetical protein
VERRHGEFRTIWKQGRAGDLERSQARSRRCSSNARPTSS